jgi:hypothetical protein
MLCNTLIVLLCAPYQIYEHRTLIPVHLHRIFELPHCAHCDCVIPLPHLYSPSWFSFRFVTLVRALILPGPYLNVTSFFFLPLCCFYSLDLSCSLSLPLLLCTLHLLTSWSCCYLLTAPCPLPSLLSLYPLHEQVIVCAHMMLFSLPSN